MKREDELLNGHGIRPTANRTMIVRVLLDAGRPLSMAEVEEALETVDKSIISRTFAALKEKHLLHTIEDGSDSVKYEICRGHGRSNSNGHGNEDNGNGGNKGTEGNEGNGGNEGTETETDNDAHVHFHCECCGRTWCFEELQVPQVQYPAGFELHFVNYMAKGVCPECVNRQKGR